MPAKPVEHTAVPTERSEKSVVRGERATLGPHRRKPAHATIPQVSIGALLGSGRADAVIVGISQRRYQAQNAELSNVVPLGDEELERLWSWDCPLEGDVYHLERTSAKHAGIMRYNLNREAEAAPR
jgi:hypothetical protein